MSLQSHYRVVSPIVELATLVGRPVTGFVHSLPKSPVSRFSKAVQLLVTSPQTMSVLIYWDRIVFIHGDCFKWGNGQLQISARRKIGTALRDLICLEPSGLLVAPTGVKLLESLMDRLNIDDTDVVEGKLVVAQVVTIAVDIGDCIVTQKRLVSIHSAPRSKMLTSRVIGEC